MSDKSRVHIIPCDVWLKIFDYGVIQDALQVPDLSSEFEKACCLYIKHHILFLHNRILQGVSTLQERLRDQSLFDDNLRLSVIKSIMFLHYLTTELNILNCTVSRYSGNRKAWMILSPHLVSVIEELDSIRRNAVDLELRREELTNFNVRLLLNKYYEFLVKFDNQLEENLSEVTTLTPFEIKAIDILSCCPSINSQLSLVKDVNQNQGYNISSFFRIHNLKPILQVPDVHNTNLSNHHKQSKLICYLRDCVQWENVSFLQNIINEIVALEIRLNSIFMDEDTRYQLITDLLEKYEKIQESPYEPIKKTVFLSDSEGGKFLVEHYTKQSTLNQNMTGLLVFVNIPNQPNLNLPIIVHSFRGMQMPFVDETVLDSNYGPFNLLKMKNHFMNSDHGFQLCINFREGLNSAPAEAIIDVSYDQSGDSHVSMNIINSQPFTPENLNDNE